MTSAPAVQMLNITAVSPAQLEVRGPAGLEEWRERLSRRVPGCEFSRAFKDGFWDGMYRPGDFMRRMPGGGFLWKGGRGLLQSLLEEFYPGFSGPIPIAFPELPVKHPEGLRDYQSESLDLIKKHGWGRIALATNAGKGAIIALAAQAVTQIGMRCLILSDEVAVFQALKDEIAYWTDDEIGLVEAGRKDIPSQRIVLAMVPTLVRRVVPPLDKKGKNPNKRLPPSETNLAWQEFMCSLQMILLDEADKATASTWQDLLKYGRNTYWRVGFSGTFPETDTVEHVKLEESVGPVLTKIKNKELIDRKISAKPQVFLCRYKCSALDLPQGRAWWGMSGMQRRLTVYDQGVVYNWERHEFVRDLLPSNVPNVIIINRIAHGHELLRVIPDAQFLDGSADKDFRSETLKGFNRGDFQNLIVTKILDRGSNQLGKAVGLVFASGEGSLRQTLQRIGRGLRRGDGKRYLYLYDIMDSGHDYLASASKRRLKLYTAEQFEVRIRR